MHATFVHSAVTEHHTEVMFLWEECLPFVCLFVKDLYIYFWRCWVFVAVWVFCRWDVQGLLCCGVWVSHCSDFSCCGAWAQVRELPWMWRESLVAPQQWDLPRPEVGPVSPALASGFLTTRPQGKSCLLFNELFKPDISHADSGMWRIIKNQLNKFRSLPLDSYHQETVSDLLIAETSPEVHANFVGLHE